MGTVWKIVIPAALWWPVVMMVAFAGISAALSAMLETDKIIWIITIPAIVKFIEVMLASNVIEKKFVSILLPRAKRSMKKKIAESLGKAEKPYEGEIITLAMAKNTMLCKCEELLSRKTESSEHGQT